jgi:hypothetical protein
MKSARTTLNFSDTIAFDERWHDAGQRYVTFNCYVSASARGIEPTLEKLARTLSPDDRFAVDMFELGSRAEGKPIWISGYLFKQRSVDDHLLCLDSMEETEVDEVIRLMDLAPEVISYAATEVISTDIRGKATNMRKFNKREQPNETITG